MVYDLEDRTIKLSISVIELCKTIDKNIINIPIVSQLMRSATSIGANYSEANGGSSKRDFINKIYICKKEAKETSYWLRLLDKTVNDKSSKDKLVLLNRETHELILIFSKIASKTNKV